MVEGHEDTRTALGSLEKRKDDWPRGYHRIPAYRAFFPEALDLAVRVDLVVLQDGHLHFLSLMLGLFGGVIGLLLAFLGTTAKAAAAE